MHSIPFKKIKEFIVFDICGQAAVLNTGNPTSLNDAPFTFMGKSHPIHMLPNGPDMDTISQATGYRCDVIPGCDVFKDTTLRIRWRDSMLDIGNDIPDTPYTMDMDTNFMNLPVLEVDVGGQTIRALLDSNSRISYLMDRLPAGAKPVGKRTDYHPLYGMFSVQAVELPVVLGPHNLNLEFANHPPKLASFISRGFLGYAISAIIGVQIFRDLDCTISWPRKTISWTS